jgi:hypothetical protein
MPTTTIDKIRSLSPQQKGVLRTVAMLHEKGEPATFPKIKEAQKQWYEEPVVANALHHLVLLQLVQCIEEVYVLEENFALIGGPSWIIDEIARSTSFQL